jgi:arylsulfatase A-like enzyme
VVLLYADDQRFDTIHALGNSQIQTPNLDRLVQEGFAFTHAHVMGGQQGAICMPSRAMLMTGRTLFRATVAPSPKSPKERTIHPQATLLPEVFRAAGYRTFATGKWHNDPASLNRAFNEGDNLFFGGMTDQRKVLVRSYDPSGQYPPQQARTNTVFSTELFTETALRFLEQVSPEQPFFLYVAYTAPHDPRTPPPEFMSRYRPEKIKLPPNFLPQHPFDNGELKVRDEQLLPWPRTPEAVRREIALYYGMITHLDDQIGRLLRTLDARGLRNNTLVVFAGDNGLAVGQHGLLGKQNLYDHSVRVPLVFRGPGVPANRRSAVLCYLHDIYPTLCELAGLRIPDTVEGQSLVPAMRGRPLQNRDTLYAAYRDVQRMVRDNRYKLIEYPRANRRQLFDIRRDPWETRDLSQEPRHAATLERLQKALRQWQESVDDPLRLAQ